MLWGAAVPLHCLMLLRFLVTSCTCSVLAMIGWLMLMSLMVQVGAAGVPFPVFQLRLGWPLQISLVHFISLRLPLMGIILSTS